MRVTDDGIIRDFPLEERGHHDYDGRRKQTLHRANTGEHREFSRVLFFHDSS